MKPFEILSKRLFWQHSDSFIHRVLITCYKDSRPILANKTCGCRGQRVHSVLTEASLLYSGHVVHILPAPEERCPPLTSSLQVMSPSERRAWASCAPYSWPSQKAILSVSKSYWKTIQMTVMNRVNVSSDKEPNDIFSSWFDILSRLLLSSAGGTSKIVR